MSKFTSSIPMFEALESRRLYSTGTPVAVEELVVNSGATFVLNSDMIVKSLQIEDGSKIDLAGHTLFVDYDSARELTADNVRGEIMAGHIVSSLVADNPDTLAVGYAENSDLMNPSDKGDDTCVVVKATLIGDATLDRKVDRDDLLVLGNSFNSGSQWSQGDFDYSSTVDRDDLLQLGNNYNSDADIFGTGEIG